MKAVTLLNLLTTANLELLHILAFVQGRESSTRITDIVHAQVFGTAPTVHVKLGVLQERGAIELKQSITDGRAKIVVVTDRGIKELQNFEDVINNLENQNA